MRRSIVCIALFAIGCGTTGTTTVVIAEKPCDHKHGGGYKPEYRVEIKLDHPTPNRRTDH